MFPCIACARESTRSTMLVRSRALHSRSGSACRSRRVHLLHPANALPGKGPAQPSAANRGLGLLEWTGKLVPQGLLVTGAKEGWKLGWQTLVRELAPQDKSGAYVRQSYSFVTKESDIKVWGVEGGVDKAEPGRYHLYLGNACPWCHRVLLAYVLRGFSQDTLSVTQLGSDPTKARRGGWIFTPQQPDPVWGAKDLWEVYDNVSPGWTGRCTAPLLVDRKEKRIISNESADIVRLLDSDAMHMPGRCSELRLRPSAAEDPSGEMAAAIDALCDKIYADVNNGVYVSGMSTTQAAYDAAQQRLFSALDDLEARLQGKRFLMGDRLTQADVWLFPTICRFDAVYAGIFRCSRKAIRVDYPNLAAWMRDMWQLQLPGFALQVKDSVDIDAARASYYTSLFPLNPSGIVPSGPRAADLQLGQPAGRGDSSSVPDCCIVRGQKLGGEQA